MNAFYRHRSIMKNLKILKEKIVPILDKWGVERASIFGSYVRDEAEEYSDIDILVELDDDVSLFDFIELKLEIEDAIGKKVDLVEFSTIKPAFRERILKEQVTLT